MAKKRIEFEALGSAAARVMEHHRMLERSRAIEHARSKFLAQTETLRLARQPSGSYHNWLLGLVPAVALAAAILLVLWTRGASPLTFRVDGKHGILDAWLAAPTQHSLFVDFSDGTGLRIENASRARVVDVTAHGAKVSIESGAIHAEVTHTNQSNWSFIAGPVNVRVTGTKFDLKWDPSLEQFTVAVLEGSVGVSGSVAGAERSVRAGETLYLSLRDRRLEITSSHSASVQVAVHPTANEPDGTALGEIAPAPAEASAVPTATGSPQVESSQVRRATRWRELASRGQLREAFAAAEALGFADACQAANPAELLLLGDAARLAGRPDRANEALLALRQRYPSDSRRAAAAFVLGKVAFDQRHAFALAASWFSTCLQEQPTGGFAREAAGRLIEAYRAAGDRNGAQTAARNYLARYPDGPHVDLARSLLP